MLRLLYLFKGNIAAITTNTLLLLLIITQYYFLLFAGTHIPPTRWPNLLQRYFWGLDIGCYADIPPLSLEDDYIKAENCTLDIANANVLFDLLGLHPMSSVDRLELFRSLDMDGDGVLRWPEITRNHVWVPVEDGGEVVDIGNPKNVTMWELAWMVEVWRRGRDVRSWFGDGERVLTELKIVHGSGLDNSVPEFFY
ncbi:hypothetical protein HDU97_004444 [Phlyctochytrium planicorne]|nr:hypothetical protein HDU97_004444 [Phlyctochytrium planicorne]